MAAISGVEGSGRRGPALNAAPRPGQVQRRCQYFRRDDSVNGARDAESRYEQADRREKSSKRDDQVMV